MIRVGTKPQCRVYRVTIYMVKVRELRVMVMHTYVVWRMTVIYDRVSELICLTTLYIPVHQSAYWSFHSTETAILSVHKDLVFSERFIAHDAGSQCGVQCSRHYVLLDVCHTVSTSQILFPAGCNRICMVAGLWTRNSRSASSMLTATFHKGQFVDQSSLSGRPTSHAATLLPGGPKNG